MTVRFFVVLGMLIWSAAPASAAGSCDSVLHFNGEMTDCLGRPTLSGDRQFLVFFQRGSTELWAPDRAEQIVREAAELFHRYSRAAAGTEPGTRLEAQTVVIHLVATAPDAPTVEEALALASRRARAIAAKLANFGVPPGSIGLSARVEPSDPEDLASRSVEILHRANVERHGLRAINP